MVNSEWLAARPVRVTALLQCSIPPARQIGLIGTEMATIDLSPWLACRAPTISRTAHWTLVIPGLAAIRLTLFAIRLRTILGRACALMPLADPINGVLPQSRTS